MTLTHINTQTYTIDQRQKWDLSAPDLAGLHLDDADQHRKAADVAMTLAVSIFVAGAAWLVVTKLPAAVLPTWLGMIGIYVVGRVGWDRVRRSF